jgi:hypothetical protein
MADNPMEIVKVLMERLKKEAAEIGLELEHVALIPNMGEGPTFLQAVFQVKTESIAEPEPEKTAEQIEFDRQFADIEQSFKIAERQEEQTGIKDEIAKWLNE